VVTGHPSGFAKGRGSRELICLGLIDYAPMLDSLKGSVGMGWLGSSPLGQELAWIGGHYGYGEVWGRPGLELRIRSFLSVAILQ
jgi:4-carboxymuconolactone decarboxylase